METTTTIDPSDRWDLDREREVPNTDYTADIPPVPGTTDVHPADCRCLTCQAWNEYHDYMEDVCECELDWICGRCRSAGVIYTPIERINDEWASLEADPYERI